MKYHLHENGWTVILDNFNMADCTQEDANLIGELVNNYTLVVAKNQFVTAEQEIRFIKMFHNPIPMMRPGDPGFDRISVDPEGLILRISGQKDADGNPTGLAGHEEEMAWHSNPPEDPDRNSIVYLRGVEGTAGSQTEWNNTILIWEEFSQEYKDKLMPLKVIPKVDVSITGYIDRDLNGREKEDQHRFNLVHTNIANKTGLYFPFIQLSRFEGMTVEESMEIMVPLFEHVTQPKYCYRHNWEDGDVVIAEQWLGIHRRLPFKNIGKRLLHRAGFDSPIIGTK
jgi:alpha-ketoglutarate-dependent taurine dioxygenase